MQLRTVSLDSPSIRQLLLQRSADLSDTLRAANLARCKYYKQVLLHASAISSSIAGASDIEFLLQADVVIFQYGPLQAPTFSVFVRRSGDQAALWQLACKGLISNGHTALKVAALPALAAPIFREAFARHGYGLDYESPNHRYETTTPVGREAAQKAAAKLQQWEHEQQAIHGPGVHAVVDSLRPEEAGLVNDTWGYRSEHTLEYVRQTVTENISVCVRLVGPGDTVHPPVAWSLNYNDGSIGMGYAVAEHRKKGLMQVVLTHLVDRVLQESPDKATYAYVVVTNTASQTLMHSLGFHRCPEDQHWMGWSQRKPLPLL